MTDNKNTVEAFLQNPDQNEIIHAISPAKGVIRETREERKQRLADEALAHAAYRLAQRRKATI